MKKLNKKITINFIFGILFPVMLVLGIPTIVLFAGKNWALMGIGIACVVVGFYGTPFIWISFASLKTKKRLLMLILNENVYTVKELSEQFGMAENDVIINVRNLIHNGYLKGYLLVNNSYIKLNDNIKQEKQKVSGVCLSCGAKSTFEGNSGICPYCGGSVKNPLNK